MDSYPPRPPRLRQALECVIADLLLDVSVELGRQAVVALKAYRFEPRAPGRGGRTLRPGKNTPLWNQLRAQLRPHLRQYGQQVNLGRMLGLPRQRINAFVTRGGEMPDAERTLQLLVWLVAVRQGRRPS
jgi:hypothetical protein